MKDMLKKLFGRGIFGTGWRNAILCLVLAVAIYGANEIYFLLNHGPAVWNLRTPLDAALPVVPPFVIPYVSLDPLVYFTLIVFLLFRTKIFQSAGLSMLAAFLVSYLFYFFFQTEVMRPALIVASTVLIKQHYVADVVSGLALAFGASWLFMRLILNRRTGEAAN